MDTVDTYADIQRNIETLETEMEEHRRGIRHALKDLDHDAFHTARMKADIVAKRLQEYRKRLEQYEVKVSKEFQAAKPRNPTSHPIRIPSDDD